MRLGGVAGLVLVLLCATSNLAGAAERHVRQGQSIQAGLSGLKPGDTLVVHAGNYMYARIEDLAGTADAWITIKGADGEARPVVHYGGSDQATVQVLNSSYIRIQGLEIKGGLGGVSFGSGTSHDVVLEGLYIHNVGGMGINASAVTELYNVTIRSCEIAFTAGTGEGICLGKANRPDAKQVHDCLIDRNYIHEMGGSVGTGIDLKHGDHSNIVQDNVVSAAAGGPAIACRGTYKNDAAYNNIVRRNLVIGSSSAGIYATSETDIQNNVVVGSLANGIHCQARDIDNKMQHVRIVNNTVYLAGGDALYLADWHAGPGLVLANNVIYQDDLTRSAINAVDGLTGASVVANLYYGTVIKPSAAGLTKGAVPTAVFTSPSAMLAEMNLYPSSASPLLNAGDAASAPADDFNLRSRPYGGGLDIGAYERRGNENPGGPLALAFKTATAPDYRGDIDDNGQVDVADLLIVVQTWGTATGKTGWDARADIDGSGSVGIFDLMVIAQEFGKN